MMKGFVTMLRTRSAGLALSAVSRATIMGITMKHVTVPAKSKITVFEEAPTMERYKGNATFPPSLVESRYLEKCARSRPVKRAVSGPTTNMAKRYITNT